LDFLGRYTSPGSGRVGGKIEECVSWDSSGPSLPGGLWSQVGTLAQDPPHLTLAQIMNLQTEIANIRDRILSKYVSIDSFIFPSLLKTIDWCIQHLPWDVDPALISWTLPICAMELVGSSHISKTQENCCIRTRKLAFRLLH
jgi:hypothetical protein